MKKAKRLFAGALAALLFAMSLPLSALADEAAIPAAESQGFEVSFEADDTGQESPPAEATPELTPEPTAEMSADTEYGISLHLAAYGWDWVYRNLNNPNGKKTVSDWGVTRQDIVTELTAHQYDNYYLSTPYHGGDWQSPNGDTKYNGSKGMNCAGFVSYVLCKLGLNSGTANFASRNASPQNSVQGLMCANGATTGGASWFGTYRARELLAGASNYSNWAMNGNLKTYAYKTKADMLSDGKLKKGDVILMLPTTGSPANRDTHLAFFWGDSSSEDKMWHSSSMPSMDSDGHKGNMITKITPVSEPSVYVVIKLDDEIDPAPTPMPTDNRTLRKENGVWRCYKDDEPDTRYTGAVRYNGGIFYVTNGILDWKYTGLTKFENTWIYIKNSRFDGTFTGAVRYNGGIFYITNGVLNWSYTGLIKFENVWIYITKSRFDGAFNGLVRYNGGLFYVTDGVLNWSYTGIAKYNTTRYYIVGSKRSFYNGTILQNGVRYTVKNGIVI